jgi:protease IV
MDNFRTLSAIMRGHWAINPVESQKLLPIVAAMLKGGTQSNTPILEIGATDYTENYRKNQELYAYNQEQRIQIAVMGAGQSSYEVRYYSGFRDAPVGSVGIIPIQGAIMKADNCGDAGSATNTMRIKEANQNGNIKAIVLKIDSPGGMVDGTSTLAQAIAESKKPVVAFADDGMMCSAAYWIGSAADEIYASSEIDVIGSIGVMSTLYDYKDYFEAQGIKVHTTYAPQSTEKNGIVKALLEDNDPEPLKAFLKTIAESFITHVTTSRGERLKVGTDHDAFKGATFFAKEAKKIGLIDGIISFEKAIERAGKLAENTKIYV